MLDAFSEISFIEIGIAIGIMIGGGLVRLVIRKESELAKLGQKPYWTPARKTLVIAAIVVVALGIVQAIIFG